MRKRLSCVLGLSLIVRFLGGCAGADCEDDSECLSGTCDWGTCSSALVESLFEDDDAYEGAYSEASSNEDATGPRSGVARCVQASCPFAFDGACEESPGCGLAFDACWDASYSPCSLADSLANNCPRPCVLRTEDECTDGCHARYECIQNADLGCASLGVDECEGRDGCIITN